MTSPNAELLRSLGRLARGLSALFWGLPATLVICAETAKADWLKPLGLVPALAGTGQAAAHFGHLILLPANWSLTMRMTRHWVQVNLTHPWGGVSEGNLLFW